MTTANRSWTRCILLLALSLSPVLSSRADSPAGDRSYEKEVRPLLATKCYACHGERKQKAGLDLRTRVGMLKGGDSGPSIVPGSTDRSPLFAMVQNREMPPQKGEKLTDAEIETLRRWIEAGAKASEPVAGTVASVVLPWSFRIPASPPVPGEVPALSSVEPLPPDHASLSGHLQAWYRADALTLNDGAPVDRWPDTSGHGRDLRPTRRPGLTGIGRAPRFVKAVAAGGRRGVRFDAESGLGSPPENPIPVQGDGAYTIIVAATLRPRFGGYPFDAIVGFGDPAPPSDPGRPIAAFLLIDRTVGGAHQFLHAGSYGHDANLGPGSFSPLYHRARVLSLTKTPGAVRNSTRVFVDGRPSTAPPIGRPVSGSSDIPDLRHRSDFGVMMGQAINGLSGISGEVGEVILYDTALSDGQRAGVEAYLARKLGVTAPADSPPYRHETSADGSERGTVTAHPGAVVARSPIDAFIRSKLREKALTPAPPADRRTLIRRLYFDVIGLPPSPARVDAFVNDPSPEAYARRVDELLSSPQYGERWGRHWLDVARYADSGGYETDMYFRNAWRYRDYVVKSFNDNKPYDVFVREQVAGDELWPDDLALDGNYTVAPQKLRNLEARTGTGLYALGPQIHESNMDSRKIRYERLTDWADTTGSVFMGLTVGCARCHDHKFDPISQRDYYGLQAAFAGSKEAEAPIIDAMGIADHKQHYPRIIAISEARKAYRLFEQRTTGRPLTPPEQHEQGRLLENLGRSVLAVPEQTALGRPFDGIMEIPTVSVLDHERPELVKPVHLLHRGDLDRPRDVIAPALPKVLAQVTGVGEDLPGPRGSRKDLALWLTRAEHPLTARVMANRIWQWHFGRGIVATPGDFGKMGQAPTHPGLLDWLATEFVASGWDVKALHRLILLSDTYRMSSQFADPSNVQRDADNHYLWRMNRRRLEAEAQWDALHAVAGTLNPKMGGPPVIPPLSEDEISGLREPSQWVVNVDPAEHSRRGLYILLRRNFRFPMFDAFDAPVNSVSCPSRDVTVVATQALWFLNNRTSHRQARHFAARLVRESGDNPAAWVQAAWRIALGRPPTEAEAGSALGLIETLSHSDAASEPVDDLPAELLKLPKSRRYALVGLGLALFNLTEFAFVD